ncbi:MAG: septum formation initiator family protein [Patescibacteria group bacterium]|nr:septum formation initiator family protein [Patescibacteria group bacterium]
MKKIGKFPKIWSYIFLILVLGYMAFIFSKTVWKNYAINQQIYKLQKETEVLQEENLRLKNLVAYYQSDSYKERMARLLLNYKNPNELVVAFPFDAKLNKDLELTESYIDTRSNLEKWYDFLFKKS